MTDNHRRCIAIDLVEARNTSRITAVELPNYGRSYLDDVAFITAMTTVLLGNYSQSGHYGGPLADTPYIVALHLAGPELGGLRYDLRHPKHPLADRFMLAGGHCVPACYALWMLLYEALDRHREATGDEAYSYDARDAVLAVDAMGFRRSPGAVSTLLADVGLRDDPLFEQARRRGIRSLAGHAESTDVTNDVNGGPSGVGVATAAGKALFWDWAGGPPDLKVVAIEGEFALTEGHAQELKTAALAQQVGKRLRVLLSWNNAGIDDRLVGGVVRERYDGYDIAMQWASYGWNVLWLDDGNDFDRVIAGLKTMEEWPADDRRPMIAVGRTTKGWWPAAVDGALPDGTPLLTGHESHPYSIGMNGDYFVSLASSFEGRYGVSFEGIRDGAPQGEAERLVQFKTNIDICLGAMGRVPGLCGWIAEQLVRIAGTLEGAEQMRIGRLADPFLDPRLAVDALPVDPVEVTERDAHSGREVTRRIELFKSPGSEAGARRAVSEVGAWLNHVTGHRFFTIAADLSESLNLEKSSFFGHYDPVENPLGTRLKAAIQEAGNVSTIIGLVSQNAAEHPGSFAGAWGVAGSYAAFTPLMYTPARVFSQQNQDSPVRLGVLTVLSGHYGPETAADGRTHFGVYAPQVWRLFPRGQVINLFLWDYNDVAPAYFAAVAHAAREREVGIVVVHVARPDYAVADRAALADPDLKAAAKGIYLLRDFDPAAPGLGTVLVQGASATVNLLAALPGLESEGVNVRVASVISNELFAHQPASYRRRVLPERARFDSMVVSSMTKRMPPVAGLGPLAEDYSLYADHDDRWRTGGTQSDVVREANLDPDSIHAAVARFAGERQERLDRQRRALGEL